MENLLQNLLISAQRYYKNPLDSNLIGQFESNLEAFQQSVVEFSNCSQITAIPVKENLVLIDCLNYFSTFLTLNECSPSILKRILTILHSLVWYNISIRKYCQQNLNLISTLSLCINQLIDKSTNIDFLSRCLKTLEILTYETEIVWTNCFPDLITYLLRTVCQKSQATVELLPYCLGSLNNLCKFSHFRHFIKKIDFIQNFYDTLLTLLQHSNTAVVINSLSLIINLNDFLKEKVLNAKNLPQTIQCIFNVIIKGDNFTARLRAVDLLCINLLTISSILPAISKHFQQNQTLHSISSLFVTLDPQREQLSKIYDLFLHFCECKNENSLKKLACFAIIQSEPVNPTKLRTPLLAIVECARITVETASNLPDLPTKALKLLKNIFEVILQNSKTNNRLQNFISPDILIRLIDDNLKLSIETSSHLVAEKCTKMLNCLKLTSVAILDEEIRMDLLDVFTPALCAHIFEFQMVSNPISIVNYSKNSLFPDWSKIGAEIVFEMINLLKSLENFSPPHKETYYRFLTDPRLLPLLAYTFSSGDEKLINRALKIFMQISSQLDVLNFEWFSELIVTKFKQNFHQNNENLANFSNNNVENNNLENFPNNFDYANLLKDENAIDDLIEKIKSNLKVNDPKITQIMQIYERKIGATQAKERQLQELLQAKTLALQQSDRVINQYRNARQESEQEAAKLRHLLQEIEMRSEQSIFETKSLKIDLENLHKLNKNLEESKKDLNMQLESSRDVISDYKTKMLNMQQINETYKREIESEKEMHDVLRKHYDNMKQNFKMTSEKLLEAEAELKQAKKSLKENQSTIKDLNETIEKMEADLREKEEKNLNLEKQCIESRILNEKIEKEKKLLNKQLLDLETEIVRKNNVIKENEKVITNMKEDIDKHSQLAEMIHKLTANK